QRSRRPARAPAREPARVRGRRRRGASARRGLSARARSRPAADRRARHGRGPAPACPLAGARTCRGGRRFRPCPRRGGGRMGIFAGTWAVLTAAGGTVALGLILAIAIGINAMSLLFFGSAVVALERFARVATRWRVIAACGLVWAALLGAFSLYWNA